MTNQARYIAAVSIISGGRNDACAPGGKARPAAASAVWQWDAALRRGHSGFHRERISSCAQSADTGPALRYPRRQGLHFRPRGLWTAKCDRSRHATPWAAGAVPHACSRLQGRATGPSFESLANSRLASFQIAPEASSAQLSLRRDALAPGRRDLRGFGLPSAAQCLVELDHAQRLVALRLDQLRARRRSSWRSVSSTSR